MTEQEDKMKLWNAVNKTDPKHTKHVGQRGGFTAINAQSQMRAATAQWGPYGTEWGMEECVYGYVNSADGSPVEIWLEAIFRYPGGSFPISSDAKYRPGDDCRKKLLTDATTKALSKLGFNADIFLGEWDDNKYVAADQPAKPGGKASSNGSGGGSQW
jgi:hypothetical protein